MSVPSRALTPGDQELIEFARQIVDANTDGEDGIHTMGAAVRGADGAMYGGINLYHFTGGPCGRDRQVLFDYHPGVRVLLPTSEGVRSVRITDLMPLGAVWSATEGTREFDPAIFGGTDDD